MGDTEPITDQVADVLVLGLAAVFAVLGMPMYAALFLLVSIRIVMARR